MVHRPDITRRDFLRVSAAGTASMWLHGCVAPSRRAGRGTEAWTRAGRSPEQLTDRKAFRRLADIALEATSADHIFITLHERVGGVTQFCSDSITNQADDRGAQISIRVTCGQQLGSAITTELTEAAVANAVSQAEHNAQEALPSPEALPPLSQQRYPVLPTYRLETAMAGRAARAEHAPEVLALYQAANFQVSGLVATSVEAVGVAADTGLFAFERRTLAELDVTSIGAGAPIKVTNANRSINDLDVTERTRQAVGRARWLATPCTLPPEPYEVILEPTAVAQLLRPLLDATDSRDPLGDAGRLCDRLGRPIIDPRFSLRNRPDHPALLGRGFDTSGLPANANAWIEDGVLTQLYYDRRAAREHNTTPTFAPDAWHLAGVEPSVETVGELIRTTKRGILVTHVDHVRCVNPTELMLTGRACDGTFLIADGEIIGSLPDCEWRQSPLRVFNQVQAFTPPLDALVSPNAVPHGAVTSGIRKLLVPAIKIRDFTLTA
jgi:predicted Zn-dependent protease